MKSHPVTEHEPMEPEYPGVLASIGMILLGWNWLADYGLDLLWAATGIEHERLWPIVHLAVSLFICYACYAKQPVKGVVKYFSLEPIPWRAAVRVPQGAAAPAVSSRRTLARPGRAASVGPLSAK